MADVELDRLVYYPELGALRRATDAGDVAAVVDYFARWREDDPARLTPAAWVVAGSAGAEALVAALLPHPLARVLRAHHRVHLAWAARTEAPAEAVAREQWERFAAHLVEAERELVELAAADPGDAPVAALRLVTCRGLELGVSEARRRYDRLAAIVPQHVFGQSAHLQTVSGKWLGSAELMFAFARECLERGGPGTPAGRLTAEAQLERWLELGPDQGTAYLRAPESREQLCAAAEASVLHPSFEAGLHGVTTHSLFAVAHSLAGRPEDAAVHFRALDGVAALEAWGYCGDPLPAFRAHHAAALRAGAAR